MRTSLGLALLGAVLVAAAGACSSRGETSTGVSDAAATADGAACTAPAATLECGQCTSTQCCPEQQACTTDVTCTLAGLDLFLCAGDGGAAALGTCYEAFRASGGPKAVDAYDCAVAHCRSECRL